MCNRGLGVEKAQDSRASWPTAHAPLFRSLERREAGAGSPGPAAVQNQARLVLGPAPSSFGISRLHPTPTPKLALSLSHRRWLCPAGFQGRLSHLKILRLLRPSEPVSAQPSPLPRPEWAPAPGRAPPLLPLQTRPPPRAAPAVPASWLT